MPRQVFVNRRWIRRAASGPVTSYLHVENRSHSPVAVRMASYSLRAVSPSCIVQGQPSSQMISAAVRDVPVVQRRAVLFVGHLSSLPFVVIDALRSARRSARAAGRFCGS